jgi:hypothetical protein
MHSHVEEDRLEQYAIGRLSAAFIPEVEEHLLICTTCQSRLVELDEFVHTFRSAVTQLETRLPFWKRAPGLLFMRVAGPIALLAIAIGLVEVSHRSPNLPAAVVLMQSLRGTDAGARIAAEKPAILVFDMPLPPPPEQCRMEIVNLNGTKVLETGTMLHEGRLAGSVRGLARGTYWVRLYRREDNELLSEFSLKTD